MFDKQSKKLSPEALEAANKLVGKTRQTSFAEELRDVADEMKKTREEAKARLLVAAKTLRESFEASDAEMNKIKVKGIEIIQSAETRHKEAVEAIRAAHPELKELEFSFDLDKGTYTPYGPLGTSPPESEDTGFLKNMLKGAFTAIELSVEETKKSKKKAEPEADDTTKQMVSDLMKRIAKKE